MLQGGALFAFALVAVLVSSLTSLDGQRRHTRETAALPLVADSNASFVATILPVKSSIEAPANPVSPACRIVFAISSGVSPNPFSRSALTGKVVALASSLACTSASSRSTLPSCRPPLSTLARRRGIVSSADFDWQTYSIRNSAIESREIDLPRDHYVHRLADRGAV